jgi:uncharacterized protein with NRDE domain
VCTLLLGISVVEPETVLLAANRDEDPRRPSDAPAILEPSPRLVGGRDRVAGGTWLAIHGRTTAVAMLNRRGRPRLPATRSRGLLALDVARDPNASIVHDALARETYAPFTLVVASASGAWLVAWDGEAANEIAIEPGWHALTHAELDDENEPRTAWLAKSLAAFRPRSRAEAEAGAIERLARHDAPAVCLHEGAMVTVSSALVWLARGDAGYAHAEGHPCTSPFVDMTHLLA